MNEGIPDWKNSLTLSTPDVVRRYTDAKDLKSVERFYLESLIEGWLRDFSFSWKSEEPPGYLELERIGCPHVCVAVKRRLSGDS